MDPAEYRRKVQEELDQAQQDTARAHEAFRGPARARGPVGDVAFTTTMRGDDAQADAIAVMVDSSESPDRRMAALEAIATEVAKRHDLIDMLLQVLGNHSEPIELRRMALDVLRASSFRAPLFAPKRPEYLETLRALVDDRDPQLRDQAIEVLAQEKDEYVQRRLLEGLQHPAGALVPPERALQFIGYDVHAEHFPLLRDILQQANTPAARLEAVRLLASDPASKDLLTRLLTDKSEHAEVRSASAAAVQALAPAEFEALARDIVLDAGDDTQVRAATMSALDHFGAGGVEPGAGAADFVERVRQLQTLTSGELRRAADRFVDRHKE